MVTFGAVKAVMRAAAAEVANLIGEVPIACRTDCAVDHASGNIVLVRQVHEPPLSLARAASRA